MAQSVDGGRDITVQTEPYMTRFARGGLRLHTVALAPLLKRRPAPNEKLMAETQRRSLAPPGARETQIVGEVGSGFHDAIPAQITDSDSILSEVVKV
jgi:hypothetical protein